LLSSSAEPAQDTVTELYSKGSVRYKEIAEALWRVYVATDATQTFLTGAPFKGLLRALNGQFPLPSDCFFSDKLPQKYEAMLQQVRYEPSLAP